MKVVQGISLIIIAIISFTLITSGVKGQDTTLIDLINIPYSISTIASDSTGTIWVSGTRGLQYYDFEKETLVTTSPNFKGQIIAIDGKVTKFDLVQNGRWVSYPWPKFEEWLLKLPPGYDRVSWAKDKFGRHWVSTGSQLFVFSVEERFEQILPGYSTRGIYRDGEDLYVNSYHGGVLKNSQPLFEKPSFAEGEIKKFGESLYFAWAGLIRYQPHIQEFNYVKFEKSTGPLKVPRPMVVQSLDQIYDTIWVGTSFGLGFVENDSVVLVSNYPDIQDVVNFKEGMLVAGSNLLIPGKKKGLRPTHNLPESDCEDCQGMYLWQKNQLRKLDVPALNYRQILEADGNYYFASDSGVVVWDGTKVTSMITKDDGLTNNQTCTMVMDDYGFLWVSTFSGLNRVNLSTRKITQYLKNIEFNYRSVFQNDSLIYMGSVRGVQIFKPKEFLGDDVEHEPSWNTIQVLVLFGVSLTMLFLVILYFVWRHKRQKLQLKEMQLREMERKLFFVQIEQIVFNTDMAITVNSLADTLNMSERTLYRTFQDYDITPGSYLKELRLKKSRNLLDGASNPDMIKEVAQKVGYTEQYLRRLLKKNN